MDRFHSSLALLKNPFIPGQDPAADKIFIQSEVTIDPKGRVVLSVDRQTPTVALNEKARRQFNVGDDVPIVAEAQKQHGVSPYWLISGGVYFWLSREAGDPKVVLLQRDVQSAAAGQWTDASGRCDRPLDRSISNEGHEELLLLHYRAKFGYYLPVTIAGADYESQPALALKYAQIMAKEVQLMEQGVPLAAIDPREASFAEYREMPGEEGLYSEVVLTLDGQEQPSFRAICLFDEQNNTLELRRSLSIDLQEGDHLIAIDGEEFNRSVQAFSRAEISAGQASGKIVTRPALGMYIEALTSATKPAFLPKHPSSPRRLLL